MELRAETFNSLDDNFDLRQLISVRTANGLRIGRLPGAEFSAEGVFVRNTYEIERLQCMALLTSGMILSIDGKMVVTITNQTASVCYMVVGFDGEMVEYESHGQLFVRPTYAAQLMTLEEIEAQEKDGNFVMPIVRFAVDDGRISVDPAYIAPSLIMASDDRLSQHCQDITRMLESIVAHANMEDGDGKRTLLRYIFHLQRYSKRNTVEDFMQLLASIANALEYFIVRPNSSQDETGEETHNLPIYSQYDVEQWISWFRGYLKDVVGVLDNVVLENHDIDYEQLKIDLRREILAVLQPEMNEQIEAIKQRLNDELQTQISSVLKEYIDGTFRNRLHDELNDELHERLRQPMYDDLYQALYNALYVPQPEEEDTFMPLI